MKPTFHFKPETVSRGKGKTVLQSFVSKFESGERRPDVPEFVAIARGLQADPALLLRRDLKPADR